MVLAEGLEPPRQRHWLLRPACLPVPPRERKPQVLIYLSSFANVFRLALTRKENQTHDGLRSAIDLESRVFGSIVKGSLLVSILGEAANAWSLD